MFESLTAYKYLHGTLKHAGTHEVLEEKHIDVEISDTGLVKEKDTDNVVLELSEVDCALILQRQKVIKLLLGPAPNEKFIVEYSFF